MMAVNVNVNMNKMMKQIWNGEYSSETQSHLVAVQRQFDANVRKCKAGQQTLKTVIEKCSTNLERIEAICPFYDWVPPRKADLAKYQKSDALATQFRQFGNDFYRNRKFKEAIRGYNLAIHFALEKKELALSFANRSAVFLGTSQPSLALNDIQRAESLGYPEDLLPKLLQRREKCVKSLQKKDSRTNELNQMDGEEFLTDEMKKRKHYCDSELFLLKNKSLQITSANSFVQIEDNAQRGRHVIVTQDIKPGTVVVVEDPFAKILLKELRWDVTHCHHCHKSINYGIPCGGCVFAHYCGEECLDSAFSQYHQYECNCLPSLHALQVPRTVFLAFRIVSKLGPPCLQQLLKDNNNNLLEKKSSDASTRIPGFENQVYDSASYLPISQLISHSDKLKIPEILSYCITSLTLANVLESRSSLFENVDVNSNFKNFVASLILLHMQNLPPNAHSLNELQNISQTVPLSSDSIRKAEVQEYGAGAFALLSLINHSCDPNVFRVNSFSGKTAVVTLQCLKMGDEILDNYGVHFAIDDLQERRLHLETNYYFSCTCSACSGDWPLYTDLKKQKEVFICSHCSENMSLQKCEPEQMQKLILTSERTCPNCGQQYDISTLIKSLNMNIDRFFTSYNLVLNNEPIIALSSLTEILEYFDKSVLSPFCKRNDSQETFKQSLNLIVYFSCFRS